MVVHVPLALVLHTWCTLLNLGRDYHCGLIGYQVKKKPRTLVSPHISSHGSPHIAMEKPIGLNQSSPAIGNIKATPPGGAFQHPAATASHCLAGRPGEPITDSQSRSQQGKFFINNQFGCSLLALQAHASGLCLLPRGGSSKATRGSMCPPFPKIKILCIIPH